MENFDVTSIMFLRMFERMMVVIIGGIAIYLGYRLFALLPTESDSAGKIQLPGFSVVLSRVGPGVFFAAFGSIFLYQSLTKPVQVNDHFLGATSMEQVGKEAPSELKQPLDQSVTPQQLERVRLSLQILNCMERVVTSTRGEMKAEDVELAVRDAKLALLESVWNQGSWGDKNAFRRWAAMRKGAVPQQVRDLYLSELPGCPES
ncbi:MAG: hypothetical protein ACFFCW_23015 [Candidatus Hodarchaeota archaeon]